jgi:hypothetical protein
LTSAACTWIFYQPSRIPHASHWEKGRERVAIGLLETGKIAKETLQAWLRILGKKDEKKDIAGYL